MSVSLFEQVVAGKAPNPLPLTVEQFHRMIEVGILREGEPIELIDGMLVQKDCGTKGSPMAHGPRHALAISKLQSLYARLESVQCHVRCQLPVTLSSFQEPEPDGAIVRNLPDAYASRHPTPDDILVVIEAADSSLEYDRTTKLRIYASAGITQYWIVNLPEHRIEVYDQPVSTEGRFNQKADFKVGQAVRLVVDSMELEIPVSQLLP
jgi:Uma2 family endonuclease